MIRHVFLDLDNTLYPASSPIGAVIEKRINDYAAGYLSLPIGTVNELRKSYIPKYGSTLSWLMQCHSFTDLEDYMDKIHPQNVDDYVPRDPGLGALLDSIQIPKSILTNSPRRHAERVLRYLGIESKFVNVFDLNFFQYRGKPNREAFERALSVIECVAADVLLVDDLASHLEAFRSMGGRTLLIDEAGSYSGDIPSIPSIHGLPSYLLPA